MISKLIIFVLIAQIYGAPQQRDGLTELADDLENWMTNLPDAIKKIPINNLAIPGTHDSFTVDIDSNQNVSPDGEDILKELEFLSIVKKVMANWSKTQAYNVTQQLEAGIRFFDLRFCLNSNDNTLYFCHSLYSTAVETVLKDLAAFLNTHPQEVVILDCQHFYGFETDTHSRVMQLLSDNFGDKLIPYQTTMDSLSLENLAAKSQQVLVVYRNSSYSKMSVLWPTESYPTPWYDTMDAASLITELDNGLKTRSNSVGYISQLVLTPKINDILGNLLSTLEKKCAIDFEAARTEWIQQQTPGEHGVNVIIADFIDMSDNNYSKIIINLNEKLIDSSGWFDTVVKQIKSFWLSFW